MAKAVNKKTEERAKYQKYLKNDMLVLSIIEAIIFLFNIGSSYIYIYIIYLALLIFGYIKAKGGEKSAGTIGIIVGILMMLTLLSGDLIDFLLGLFITIHSSKYISLFK